MQRLALLAVVVAVAVIGVRFVAMPYESHESHVQERAPAPASAPFGPNARAVERGESLASSSIGVTSSEVTSMAPPASERAAVRSGSSTVVISGRVVNSAGSGVEAETFVRTSWGQVLRTGDHPEGRSPVGNDGEFRFVVDLHRDQVHFIVVAEHLGVSAATRVDAVVGGGEIDGVDIVLPDAWTEQVVLTHEHGEAALHRLQLSSRILGTEPWWSPPAERRDDRLEGRRTFEVRRDSVAPTSVRVTWRHCEAADEFVVLETELPPTSAESAHREGDFVFDLTSHVDLLGVMAFDRQGTRVPCGWRLVDPAGHRIDSRLDLGTQLLQLDHPHVDFQHPRWNAALAPGPPPDFEAALVRCFQFARVTPWARGAEPDAHEVEWVDQLFGPPVDVPRRMAPECRLVVPGQPGCHILFEESTGWRVSVGQPLRRAVITADGLPDQMQPGGLAMLIGATASGSAVFHWGGSGFSDQGVFIPWFDADLGATERADQAYTGVESLAGNYAYGSSFEDEALLVWLVGRAGQIEVDASALSFVEMEDGSVRLDIDPATAALWSELAEAIR